MSPRPHPEPGGGGVVEAQGPGRGAPQARDGGGAVAEREAEGERAQGGGEGGEEDPATERGAAGTGRLVSGAGLGAAEGARPLPGLSHPPTRSPAAGRPQERLGLLLVLRRHVCTQRLLGQLCCLNCHGSRECSTHPPLTAEPANGRGGSAQGRDRNGQWERKAGLASALGATPYQSRPMGEKSRLVSLTGTAPRT